MSVELTAELELKHGLEALGLSLGANARRKLMEYLHLLRKWNRAYNLTAIRDLPQMVSRHLLDSLSIIPLLQGERIADIGSGAGLPGIPLAIVQPQYRFSLLDSNGKKIRFLTQVVAQLGLQNVEIVHGRAEKFQPEQKFDTLVCRALSSMSEFLASSAHLCVPGGRFVAMKGVYPECELAEIPDIYTVADVRALRVPGIDAPRHGIIIKWAERAA